MGVGKLLKGDMIDCEIQTSLSIINPGVMNRGIECCDWFESWGEDNREVVVYKVQWHQHSCLTLWNLNKILNWVNASGHPAVRFFLHQLHKACSVAIHLKTSALMSDYVPIYINRLQYKYRPHLLILEWWIGMLNVVN